MHQVTVITFDAGHTLIHPWPTVGEVYAEAMASHGLHRPPAQVHDAWEWAWQVAQGRPRHPESPTWERDWWRLLVRDVVTRLEGQAEGPGFEALFADLWDAFAAPHRWRLYDAAHEVLATLARRGYRLGLLSNWDLRLRDLLHGLDLARHFEHLIISGEVGVEKPDPRIFSEAVKRFAVPAAHCLHIGDSVYHDIAGARDAGWQGLHLDYAGTSAESPSATSLVALLALLPGPATPPLITSRAEIAP